MEYAILLHEDETIWDRLTPDAMEEAMAAHGRFAEAVETEGGAVLGGAELQPSGTARSLRWTGERVGVVDGPYAETAEQFGGLYLIDAPDLDQAIEWCRLLPHSVEIRPVAVQEDPVQDPSREGSTPEEPDQSDAEGVRALALLYGDEEPCEQAGEAERATVYARHDRFAQSVLDAGGAVLGGRELAHSSTATSLRRDGEEVQITDGPYTESVQQLSGWYDLRAPDMATLERLLQGLPGGTTEIRPTTG